MSQLAKRSTGFLIVLSYADLHSIASSVFDAVVWPGMLLKKALQFVKMRRDKLVPSAPLTTISV